MRRALALIASAERSDGRIGKVGRPEGCGA